MSEIITVGYKRLFEIRLLHHYWLDSGLTLFDNLATVTIEKRLLTYDSRHFLKIQPTVNTETSIKGLRGVFKETQLGCVVLVPHDTVVPDDAVFEFTLIPRHHEFHNYTFHSFYDRRIYEIYHAPEKKMYRFRENVFVLSNTTGSKRGTNLFLSKEFPVIALPATSYSVESLLESAGTLIQIADEIGGTEILYQSAAPGTLPVFLHQGDIESIVPPAGMIGAPANGVTLTSDIPDDVYALIRIRAVHPSDPDFSCTNAGLAKTTAPVFQVRFKNRLSIWRYKNKINPALPFTDLGPFPLTFFGNATPGPTQRQKPAQTSIQAQFNPAKKIEKIISEIFE